MTKTPSIIYLRCDCHTPHHFLAFEPDADEPECIYVSFVSTRNGSFWHRVRWAFYHVFKREDLTFADIIIKRTELRETLSSLGERDG